MTISKLFPASQPRSAAIFSAIALFSVIATPAQAETSLCTEITSLPATLNVQGIYCLKRDLSTNITSGTAITINNNNITIDFNGFKLGGAAGGAGTQSIGIYAVNRKNLVLRNGLIRGFSTGVLFDDSDGDYSNTGGYRLSDLALDVNTGTSVFLKGNGNSIRNVRVNMTGGSTVYADAYGIINFGAGGDISYNTVRATAAGAGLSAGIYVVGHTTVIAHNQVTDTTFASGGPGYGIYVGGVENLIEDNAVINSALVAGTTGIITSSTTKNLCTGNKIGAFSTSIAACKDGGGNLIF